MNNISTLLDEKYFYPLQKLVTQVEYDYCVVKLQYTPIVDILIQNKTEFVEIQTAIDNFKKYHTI
jgi:hypothetical protein